jgi:hypothetical protein
MSVLRACVWCGKEFQPSRSDGLFHSKPCKQAYWRWKHKLNLYRHQVYQAISEMEQYLAHENTRKEAENALGEIADRLAAMGFEASDKQLPIPEFAHTISNQLGDEDNA